VVTITAKLIAVTQPVIGVPAANAEALVAYCARVSNPKNQDNPDYGKLLNYCMEHKHWSVFEMANAVVEVEAPRDITRQLLRHRSFSFQEFSQRYSDEIEMTNREFRRQDSKNRQNSIDDYQEETKNTLQEKLWWIKELTQDVYRQFRSADVAKECARVVLPEGLTMSRLYVNGTLRSWLHYLDIRDDPGVSQHEHVLLAREIRSCLEPAFPALIKVNNEQDK